MERALTINLGLNTAPAQAASEKFHEGEKQRISRLLTNQEVAEKAKTSLIDRENQRRVAAAVASAEKQQGLMAKALDAEQGMRAKSLTYVQIVEAAKSKLIESENARRVASMAQSLAGEDQRVAKSLNDRQVSEAAKSKAVESENQKRIEAAFRALQSEDDRVGRSLTATEVAERAKAAIVDRSNKAKVDAVVRSSATEEERIGRVLTDTEVAERAKAALIDRTNRQKIDAATKSSMTEEQLLTRVLTKEEVTQAARNNLIQKANQKRVDSETKALEKSQAKWGGLGSTIGTVVKSLGSYSAQMLGISSVTSVISMITGAFEKASQAALEAGKFVQGYRETLLELAALKGLGGNTTEVLKQDLELRAKTGQTQGEATSFQTAALGSGAAAVGTFIQKDEMKNLITDAGKLQATQHIDATAIGQLTGMMPSLMGKQVTGKEAFAKEKQIIDLFDPGGADYSSLTSQYLKLAPDIQNKIYKSPEEAAGLLSAFSLTNPNGAGENANQFTRATVGSLGRLKNVNIEGSVEKQAEYMKRIGANDQMSPVDIGKLISQDFGNQEVAEQAKGRKFNSLTYLQQHGYANQEDIKSLQTFHGLYSGGQYNKFEGIQNKPLSYQEAIAPINKTLTTEPVFVNRRSQLEAQQADIATGAGKVETMDSIHRSAFARLKTEGKITGDYDKDWRGAWSMGATNIGNMLSGGGDGVNMINMRAQEMIEAAAKESGVEMPKVDDLVLRGAADKQVRNLKSTYGDAMGEDKLYETVKKIQAAGGDVLAGRESQDKKTGDALDATKNLVDATKNLNEAVGKMPKAEKPVVQGRPPVQRR